MLLQEMRHAWVWLAHSAAQVIVGNSADEVDIHACRCDFAYQVRNLALEAFSLPVALGLVFIFHVASLIAHKGDVVTTVTQLNQLFFYFHFVEQLPIVLIHSVRFARFGHNDRAINVKKSGLEPRLVCILIILRVEKVQQIALLVVCPLANDGSQFSLSTRQQECVHAGEFACVITCARVF